ncbi:unnamed protein product [Linum tenue]|uniref:Uncharacterized protein n=2 Tax=Linum TaxID=4005 RepID=A0AAV0KNV6_9ROSI|nr:unnamed protein product [Linum tenue]
MEEIAVVLKRFGDEQSSLLDQFERLSFEVQLNQAILARSLSEPGVGPGAGTGRSGLRTPLNRKEQRAAAVGLTKVKHGQETEPERRRRGSSFTFNKLWKKLLKPILGRKTVNKATAAAPAPAPGKRADFSGPKLCKAFSRSVRF